METTRAGHGMPDLVTLTVADPARTVDWYTNGLDFVVLAGSPDGALAHLRRWRHQDILVRRGEPAGGRWAYRVRATAEQLDGIARRGHAHGGGAVDGPLDSPWGARDLHTIDPDGYTVVFTAERFSIARGWPPLTTDPEPTARADP